MAEFEDPGAAMGPCAERVLQDILSSEYRYSKDTRMTTFHYIEEHDIRELTPLLIEIAQLNRNHQQEWKTTLDWISIRAALELLRKFDPGSAVYLSEQRLQPHTWIQPVAIRNLRLLEHWGSTEQISQLICEIPIDAKFDTTIAAAARFLLESPRTTKAVCRCVTRAIESLPQRRVLSSFARDSLSNLKKIDHQVCEASVSVP